MPVRPALAVAGIVALVLVAAVAVARGMPPIVTSSDLAVTELHVELAARGELTTGPDSRFAWNHPGPLYFYVLAPMYAAAGHRAAALFTGAVAINLAAIAVIVWVASRVDRGVLPMVLALACVVLAWRLPRLLASPWTAHIPVLASLTFVTICAAIVSGRHRLLPLLMLAGSFITQTHVSYVPMVGVLSTMAIVSVIGRRGRESLTVIAFSAAVWLLVWSPALIEAARYGGGNLAALWRFFVAEAGASHSLSDALRYWSHALTGILRPDLQLPWGAHFSVGDSWWRLPLVMVQVMGLGAVSWRAFRKGRPAEGALAGCALTATAIGLWAISRIRGDVVDHELFGLVALGTLNMAILLGAALAPLRETWPAARVNAAAGIALAVCAFIGVRHFQAFTSFELRRSDTPRIPATYEILRSYFEQTGIARPLIRLEGDAASDGTAILLRLLQAGWTFTVEESGTSVFPPGFAATGSEDALVNISAREGIHLSIASRPGNVVLRDRHPLFVDVVRLLSPL